MEFSVSELYPARPVRRLPGRDGRLRREHQAGAGEVQAARQHARVLHVRQRVGG